MTVFKNYRYHYRPQRSWSKVIFSQASVILSTGGRVLPPGGCQGIAWWRSPRDGYCCGTSYWNAFLLTFQCLYYFTFCLNILLQPGIFTPTLDGTYYLAVSVQARDDNAEMMIMRNNDVLCSTWVSNSPADVASYSATAVLSAGDSVRVTGSSSQPGRVSGGNTGFTGFLIRP